MKQTFELTDESIELYKLLKVVGMVGSGGMAKMMIAEGMVRVDGEVELRKRCKVKKGQTVSCEGEEVEVV